MAIKTTRWRPDTCGCELEYTWDSSVPLDQRQHTVSRIIVACPAHANLANMAEQYDKVLDENVRKNKVYKLLLENFSALVKVDTDGNDVLKDDAYQWSFNDKRELEVTVPLSTSQKGQLQTLADSLVGTGKVNIK